MKRKILAVLVAVAILVVLLPIQPLTVSADRAVSPEFLTVLKKIEGFSAVPYEDYSQYSIGYGSYCDPSMVEYYRQNPITEAQAEQMLLEQLVDYVNPVNRFAADHGLNLEQHQFDALVSFTYNCGTGWMSELTGFFNAAVRDGDLGNDLIYGMMLYSTAGGQYILTNRRMCEANMYINGVYRAYNEGDGTGNYPDSYRWVFLDAGVGKVRYKICGFDGDLAEPIDVSLSLIPTGVDAYGNRFVYTLAGWYTASGRKVEHLDNSLTRGETLYAKWADPNGNIVTPPAQTEPEIAFPRSGTVINVQNTVNVRTGPGTNYGKNGTLSKGAQVTVLEEVTGGTYSGGGESQNIWCKLSDNQWVGKYYIGYSSNPITGIRLLKAPTKTVYTQPIATVDPVGSVLQVTYESGHIQALTLHRTMLSGFNGKQAGRQTVTVTYGGQTTSFQVTVQPPVPSTITSWAFRVRDGYLFGVQPGTTAEQLLLGMNEREYIKLYGPDGELSGHDLVGTDTVVLLLDGDEEKDRCTVVIRGDLNGDGRIDGNDATLLMQQQAGWGVYVSAVAGDVTGDGYTNGSDVTLLLQHTAGWNIPVGQ